MNTIQHPHFNDMMDFDFESSDQQTDFGTDIGALTFGNGTGFASQGSGDRSFPNVGNNQPQHGYPLANQFMNMDPRSFYNVRYSLL
jgi:hypothetical protein